MTLDLFPDALPEGLKILNDFIDVDEEVAIEAMLNGLTADSSLRRRTWHFGRRYDYTSSRVSSGENVPAIPPLFRRIGTRLVECEIFESEPDQVIVNEYVVRDGYKDGIAAHTDRMDCFGPVVVTVSLLESWIMHFSRGDHESINVLLPRYSATVMSGPSRTQWRHEIQPRSHDRIGGIRYLRHRRLSVTFRTVNEGY